MRSLTGAIAIPIRRSARGLLAGLLLAAPGIAPGIAWGAPCPSSVPVAQHAMVPTAIGRVEVRALQPESRALPRLELLDRNCRVLLSAGFGAPDPAAQGSEPPPHALRFRALHIGGMPDPVVLATMASPGASDTEFETQLFAAEGGRFRRLLPHPVTSLLEGGVFVGDLGNGIGPGVAVWNMAWRSDEVHADPHRYTLRRWRWIGNGFAAMPVRTTRDRYGEPAAALGELGVDYRDMTQDFADFAKYR